MKVSILTVLLCVSLGACSNLEPNVYEEYLTLAPAKFDSAKHPRLKNFEKLFNGLKDGELTTLVPAAYAEKLYFNDTLVTLHEREKLLNYFKKTQTNLEAIKVEILGILDDGSDALVRWKMFTQFTVLGQTKHVDSIGITHLRFDSAGKIILHQDYWDSMQGFYLHLPVIGGFLQWLKNGLHD